MTKKALVIGNNNYLHGKLSKSENDALDMTAFLKDVNFTVYDYYNLDYNKFWDAIEDFAEEIKETQIRLIFFSGHGIHYEGDNYLVPVNNNFDFVDGIKQNCINLSKVLERLKIDKKATNIIILDCCNSKPLSFEFKSENSVGFAPVKPSGSIIGIAAEVGSLAIAEKNSRNSIYTHTLLNNIIIPNLSIEEVLKSTTRDVISYTQNKQRPIYISSFIGNFQFISNTKNNDVERISKKVKSRQNIIKPSDYGYRTDNDGNYIVTETPHAIMSYRIGRAFPGVRGLKWFYDKEAVERLKHFFNFPLDYKKPRTHNYELHIDPIWWMRGSASNHIKNFKTITEEKILLNEYELLLDKVAIFKSNNYKSSFIYIQTKADKSIGLEEYKENRIKSDLEDIGYLSEMYGLYKKQPIRIEEFDDGGTYINGDYEELTPYNTETRVRYLTPYNLIIAGKTSPIHNNNGFMLMDKYMNKILTNDLTLEEFAEKTMKL